MQLSDEQLRGRSVIAADGQAIGEVGALLIDPSAWTVVALRVKLHNAVAETIGAARSILRAATIELSVRLVQSVGDAVLLSVPTPELRNIPPDTDDGHESKT
jgi:sporulation protein YlmC with PRC-barrel domain